MINFHAVMEDETGCEFGAEVEAHNRSHAYDLLQEDYPESRVVQLESPQDRRDRQHSMLSIMQTTMYESDDYGY